jgi:hypothetical protein
LGFYRAPRIFLTGLEDQRGFYGPNRLHGQIIETGPAANDDTIVMIMMVLLVKSTSFSVSAVEVAVFQLSVSSPESSASQLLGNLEGGSYTGNFERRMQEGSGKGASLYEGAL